MAANVKCRNCEKYYSFFADDGTLLDEGCSLDLPIFNSKNPIVCNSYDFFKRG